MASIAYLLLVVFAAVALSSVTGAPAPRPRWVVECKPNKCLRLKQALHHRGFMVKASGKNFVAVEKDPSAVRWAKEADLSIEASFGNFSAYGGESIEQDAVMLSVGMPKEELQDTTTYGYCLTSDVPSGSGSETLTYGVQMVQGNSSKMAQEVPTLEGKHVVVCIIDSGIWAQHPDLSNGISMDGCKFADSDSPGGCPFTWSGDIVGHGTHVAGTIGAPANGVGVVGVIPKGARLYVVRVFNQTGDVSQGEGIVYGSSLLTAYTQCEGHLEYLKAHDHPSWRMVVSMSLGAPGPLTMEKLFFREAGARPDMLFVAAAGNHGSQDVQWDSYPGSYDEVMSVAAVDCAENVAPFSQYNGRVDVAGPGVDVLSTLPQGMGFRLGTLTLGASAKAQEMRGAQAARHSGLGTVTGQVVDCGKGDGPCDVAGKLCMIQAGSTNPLLKHNCDRTLYCASQGAVGVLLVPPADWGLERGYTATLNCHPCTCWSVLNKAPSRVPPVVGLTLKQATEMRATLKAAGAKAAPAGASIMGLFGRTPAKAAAAESAVLATVTTRTSDYAAWSGTSMATPHVSGTAARIWANFPNCTAQEVRAALETTARQPKGFTGFNDKTGHGLIQMESAYTWLAGRPCSGGATAAAAAAAAAKKKKSARKAGPQRP